MRPPLRISVIQTDIFWESPVANLSSLEEKIAHLGQATDIIILPEMFNAGFSMEYAEPMNAYTHKWMKQIAKQYETHVLGSLAVVEHQKKYNRCLFVSPAGETRWYDKKHLFGLGGEAVSFSAGSTKTSIECKAWQLQPMICYDLRFPVWCRNTSVDLMIFVASWPKARIEAWDTLLKARAIENQCYVVGVNRIGRDGNGLQYNGHSVVIDFEGKCLADLQGTEGEVQLSLDFERLENFRSKLPFWKDADEFQIVDF
jgi:omega-amidase